MMLFIALLLVSVPLYADSSAATLIAQADAAYALRINLTQAKTALSDYTAAIAADPANIEAYWKASRVAWWVGDHSESRADKMLYFQKGIDFAKAALTRDSKSVDAHYWLGGNYGSFGETKGVLKSLFLVKPIRLEMAEVLRLDDHYDGGGGYRVLGIVDYQVPGFAGGNKKRALEELNKSLAIDPRNPFTHYYLAEYFKTIGEKEKSRAELQTLRSMQVTSDLQPEWEMLKQKAVKNFGS